VSTAVIRHTCNPNNLDKTPILVLSNSAVVLYRNKIRPVFFIISESQNRIFRFILANDATSRRN